jgi:hypothetical protein
MPGKELLTNSLMIPVFAAGFKFFPEFLLFFIRHPFPFFSQS